MSTTAEQFRAILEDENQKWDRAIMKGTPEELGELVTEDFIYAESGRPILVGREHIVSLCRDWQTAGVQDEVFEIIDYGCSGDIGYQLSAFTCKIPSASGVLERVSGRFMDVFVRRDGNRWLRRTQSVTID